MTTDTPPALRMKGIRKAFPGVLALDGVDLEVRRGEVHVLLGENGAGKSTLMKILSGALARDAGDIEIEGQPVQIGTPREAQRLGVRTIYQELTLFPYLSSAENISRLDELKAINRRLALEPDIPPAERDELVAKGRVFVLATLIHALLGGGPLPDAAALRL